MAAAAPDVIIIGSGIAALSSAAALTAYGKTPLLLESHTVPGGVAHGFDAKTKHGTFHFDTGPSFFCGLTTPRSLNPLKHALDAVDEQVPCVSYDHFCIDDLSRRATVQIGCDPVKTFASVTAVAGPEAARQLHTFYDAMVRMYAALDVPAIALRGDWRLIPVIARRWAPNLARLLPYVSDIDKPVSRIMRRLGVNDPFVRQLLDMEAFLLSGLKTGKTITAEIAFMVGERGKQNAMQYPIGGARSIIRALVRGIERKGGHLRLRSHVDRILVRNHVAVGVQLRSGDKIYANHVFSNASLWDTVHHLLPDHDLPAAYRKQAMETPVVESFMHAHIAIPREGLDNIVGHHAVIIDSNKDISVPGNVVMISIPTLWSPDMAPEGWHIIHAYTLENYDRWPALAKDRKLYIAAKKAAAEPLMTAIRHVIPDLDERMKQDGVIVKLGSPMTHAKFNRRYKGSYGAAIDAGNAAFEWPGDIPIQNLKRCSDSTFPGIGVPSSAAAGLIAANELASVSQHNALIDRVFPDILRS